MKGRPVAGGGVGGGGFFGVGGGGGRALARALRVVSGEAAERGMILYGSGGGGWVGHPVPRAPSLQRIPPGGYFSKKSKIWRRRKSQCQHLLGLLSSTSSV